MAAPTVIHSLPGRSSFGSQASAAAIASRVPFGSLGPRQVLVGASARIELTRTSSGTSAQAASRKAAQLASSTTGSRDSGVSTRLSSGHS